MHAAILFFSYSLNIIALFYFLEKETPNIISLHVYILKLGI